MNDINGSLTSVQQSLSDAADGFKQMMVALLIFSLVVTISFIVISIKTTK